MIRSHVFLFALLAGCALVLLANPVAIAKDNAKEKTISPRDIEDFEGAGIYSRSSDLSLGGDFWEDTERSQLTALYKVMPATSRNPVVQQLIRQVLLTQSYADEISNDVEAIPPGEDLLTLRMEKLLDAGLYKQAKALYLELEKPVYHERLMRTGLLAMVLSDEKALACIDAKSFSKDFKKNSFFGVFAAYCGHGKNDSEKASEKTAEKDSDTKPNDVILYEGEEATETEENPLVFDESHKKELAALIKFKTEDKRYSLAEFKKLGDEEQAIAFAEKRLDASDIKPKDIAKIEAPLLPLVISSMDKESKAYVPALIQAISWGYDYQDTLKAAYMNALPTASGDTDIKKAKNDIERMAIFYSQAKDADSDEAEWEALASALVTGQKMGLASLGPFLDLLEETSKPKTIPPKQLDLAYEAFIVSGRSVPSHWQVDKLEFENKTSLNTEELRQLTESYIFTNSSNKKSLTAKNIFSHLEGQSDQNKAVITGIIGKFDISDDRDNNNEEFYENIFYLTFQQDYVMPSMHIWNQMRLAKKNKNKAKTVLLSMLILQDESIKDVYPGLLNEVANGLNNVGLTDASQNLALYAVLKSIN